MTMQATHTDTDTRHQPSTTRRATSYHTTDQSIFTAQDIAGAVLIVIMIWGPLAAGAFLAP